LEVVRKTDEARVIGFRVGCGVPPACEGILPERFLTRYRSAASHLANKVMLRIMEGVFGGTPKTAGETPARRPPYPWISASPMRFLTTSIRTRAILINASLCKSK